MTGAILILSMFLNLEEARMTVQKISSGLGLFEYLTWCEDLGMEPIMAVWSGK